MHQDGEDKIGIFAPLLTVFQEPHEFVFPHLLDDARGHVAHAVGEMGQVL